MNNIKNINKILDIKINEKNVKCKNAKKIRGEVFTPITLVNEMLDTLPETVWNNKHLKWLEPSAGTGNFILIIYMRLMEGLKNIVTDEEQRRKHILENMIYMVELDVNNCNIIKDIFKDYNINLYQDSFIDFKHFKKVNFPIKFDIILGNPPYQYKEPNKKSQTIWHLFIKRSYNELINHNGFLLFVHPSAWRDIKGNMRFIFDIYKKLNMIYLNMNDYKKGKKVFDGVGTNFDYYLVQNTLTNDNITIINDIDDNEYNINLNEWIFIPSGKFNQFKLLLAKTDNTNVIYDRTKYGIDKKNVLNEKNNDYIFPCIYSITQKDGCKFKYSNVNKGHFGIPKVIWSNGAGTFPIIDENGKYGLTQYSYAIVDDKKNLQKIRDAMLNDDFINLMKYLAFKESQKYNYKIIALFKKDFYKYFV